jgi:hypothetical protein
MAAGRVERATELGAPPGPIYFTATVFSCVAAVYGTAGIRPSPLIALGLTLGPLLAAAAWVQRDARTRHVALAYDWGFFLFAMAPAFLAWYAFAIRGRRGIGLAAKIFIALIAPNVVLALFHQA